MAFRDVRLKEMNNRLVFRFDPEQDVIEIVVNRRLVSVPLSEYRCSHERRPVGVDFQLIEHGNEADR